MREETGLQVQIKRLIGLYSLRGESGYRCRVFWVAFTSGELVRRHGRSGRGVVRQLTTLPELAFPHNMKDHRGLGGCTAGPARPERHLPLAFPVVAGGGEYGVVLRAVVMKPV